MGDKMKQNTAQEVIRERDERIAELEADLASETKLSGDWFAWHVRAAEEDNEIIEEWQERTKQAEADLNEEHEHTERLEKKLRSWGAGCCCEYDNEGDVCATHHPRIQAAEAALATLTSTLEEECYHHNRTKEKRDAALDVCRAFVKSVRKYSNPMDRGGFPPGMWDAFDPDDGLIAKHVHAKHEGSVKG